LDPFDFDHLGLLVQVRRVEPDPRDAAGPTGKDIVGMPLPVAQDGETDLLSGHEAGVAPFDLGRPEPLRGPGVAAFRAEGDELAGVPVDVETVRRAAVDVRIGTRDGHDQPAVAQRQWGHRMGGLPLPHPIAEVPFVEHLLLDAGRDRRERGSCQQKRTEE